MVWAQGQFIWAKYAFDELSAREGLWTPADIQKTLPSGLYGVYRLILSTLQVRAYQRAPPTRSCDLWYPPGHLP